MATGTVFNIQKFSIHDGPGIRTTVFLKGCPLRCKWCHNPEGLSRDSEVEFEATKCVYCARCVHACSHGGHTVADGVHDIDRTACIRCGMCAESCLCGALRVVGDTKSPEDVIAKVLEDKIFYQSSGGGMTVSGGEPFYQHEFTLELLRLARKNGISTAVETSGFCRSEIIREAVPLVDLFLFDYKATGEELHRELTGVPQDIILENLKLIGELGGKIVLRCPIIPGANDTDDHFAAIASIAEENDGIIGVDLEPYHPLGVGKAPKIGKTQEFVTEAPSDERMAEILAYISSRTSKKVKIS